MKFIVTICLLIIFLIGLWVFCSGLSNKLDHTIKVQYKMKGIFVMVLSAGVMVLYRIMSMMPW